jgi:hypothetical protein
MMLALLASAILGSSGCIHTETGTYAEFPDAAYDRPPAHVQGDPKDEWGTIGWNPARWPGDQPATAPYRIDRLIGAGAERLGKNRIEDLGFQIADS